MRYLMLVAWLLKIKYFSLVQNVRQANIIREEVERSGMPYVAHRWLGGMLTNYKTIGQSISVCVTCLRKRLMERLIS